MFKKVLSILIGIAVLFLGSVLIYTSLQGQYHLTNGENDKTVGILTGISILVIVALGLAYAINSLFHKGSFIKKFISFAGIAALIVGVVVYILCYTPNGKPVISEEKRLAWAQYVYFFAIAGAIACYIVTLVFSIFSKYKKPLTKWLSLAIIVLIVVSAILFFANLASGSNEFVIRNDEGKIIVDFGKTIAVVTSIMVGFTAISTSLLYFYNVSYKEQQNN